MKIKSLSKIIILSTYLSILTTTSAISTQQKKGNQKFSLNTGSFVYHAYNLDKTKQTQFFDNKYFSASIKVSDSNALVVGTFLNSYGNRCVLLGLEKNWHNFNNKLSFEGLYAYAGDFFFEPLDHCGDKGIYKKFKNITGVGFAPYLYHGIEYDINKIISLDLGIILPGILVASLGWKF